MNQIRVVVVDDSAFMRKMLSEVLMQDPSIAVVATAMNGDQGVKAVKQFRPDVVTLDVEMPIMNGEEALAQIMEECPTPCVMLSSMTQVGSQVAIRCLSEGAIDVIGKPTGSASLDITKIRDEIVAKVKAAAHSRVHHRRSPTPSTVQFKPLRSPKRFELIVIGCSTGGPKALQHLIPALSPGIGVPVVVVQHMPPHFTASLAERLNDLSQLNVKEAVNGDKLTKNEVLIAPGGLHLTFDQLLRANLSDLPPMHGVRPAIDVTIASIVPTIGSKTLAILLTGMGRDGAAGLRAIKEAGGSTIAEDESTCVVYGMPKCAKEIGAVDHLLPLYQIGPAVNQLVAGIREAA